MFVVHADSDLSVQISNDVGSWKNLSASERDAVKRTTAREHTKRQQGQIISDEHFFKKNAK